MAASTPSRVLIRHGNTAKNLHSVTRWYHVYEKMYGQKPAVVAIHAGLECGLFYKKIEGLDCVSLGPDMKDIHTSEEVLDIASTERVWNYLVKVLEQLKD